MAKHVLLVGISGLGRVLYRPLAELGYRKAMVAYYQDRAAAEHWANQAKLRGLETTVAQLDATNPDAVRRLFEPVERLDAVISLQGHFIMKPPLEYTSEELTAVFASNYFANYYLAKYALPKLRVTNGSLVFFGVAHADQLHSQPMTIPYAAAKTALLVLMRSLARTEAEFGVRVNMISPGLMQHEETTPEDEADSKKMIPAGRHGTPKDVASAVKYLLSEESSYLTGTNLILSGGWAI